MVAAAGRPSGVRLNSAFYASARALLVASSSGALERFGRTFAPKRRSTADGTFCIFLLHSDLLVLQAAMFDALFHAAAVERPGDETLAAVVRLFLVLWCLNAGL